MKHLIISYKTRTSLLAFSKILKSNQIFAETINTPRSIAISCGLSLKVDIKHFSIVKNLIRQANISGFIGLFISNSSNQYSEYQKIM